MKRKIGIVLIGMLCLFNLFRMQAQTIKSAEVSYGTIWGPRDNSSKEGYKFYFFTKIQLVEPELINSIKIEYIYIRDKVYGTQNITLTKEDGKVYYEVEGVRRVVKPSGILIDSGAICENFLIDELSESQIFISFKNKANQNVSRTISARTFNSLGSME
ncbi:hypothetical protein DMA11_17995 [Marinilabiliaceae bacterium JC017]|nr:hypothetical protein DMA11_17995 [Marinilabiliaceae bacterium JC017]